MTVRQAKKKSTQRSRDVAFGTEAQSALEEVCFLYRVLEDRYVDLLKRSLRRQGLDDIIRPGFGFVLFALFEEEVLRPSEICQRTGLKASTLTAIVDQMVEIGLVDRRPDDKDRRAIQLRLLPKGEEIRDACYQILDENTETIGRGISQRYLEITKRVMRQMIKNMATSE